VVFLALKPLKDKINERTVPFEEPYDQVNVLLLEVRVRLGRFSWLVRENDTEALLEFGFGVCMAIRILQG
jgi:hypothetical protein